MTGIVILAPIYWWETDSEKGLRILQINYRTKIYTQVQIPHFCFSTAATENKLIDNPWSLIFPFCIEMYTNLLGKCSTQTLTLKHFLCISVPQFTNFLSGSFISFLYLTDNVRYQICNPNTKITRQMSQHKTIKTCSSFHQSELALLGQQKLTIITPMNMTADIDGAEIRSLRQQLAHRSTVYSTVIRKEGKSESAVHLFRLDLRYITWILLKHILLLCVLIWVLLCFWHRSKFLIWSTLYHLFYWNFHCQANHTFSFLLGPAWELYSGKLEQRKEQCPKRTLPSHQARFMIG